MPLEVMIEQVRAEALEAIMRSAKTISAGMLAQLLDFAVSLEDQHYAKVTAQWRESHLTDK